MIKHVQNVLSAVKKVSSKHTLCLCSRRSNALLLSEHIKTFMLEMYALFVDSYGVSVHVKTFIHQFGYFNIFFFFFEKLVALQVIY